MDYRFVNQADQAAELVLSWAPLPRPRSGTTPVMFDKQIPYDQALGEYRLESITLFTTDGEALAVYYDENFEQETRFRITDYPTDTPYASGWQWDAPPERRRFPGL